MDRIIENLNRYQLENEIVEKIKKAYKEIYEEGGRQTGQKASQEQGTPHRKR